jgi:hypothetical protein
MYSFDLFLKINKINHFYLFNKKMDLYQILFGCIIIIGLLLLILGSINLATDVSTECTSPANITSMNTYSTGILVIGIILILIGIILFKGYGKDFYFYIFILLIFAGIVIVTLGGLLNTVLEDCTQDNKITSLITQSEIVWICGIILVIVLSIIVVYMYYTDKNNDAKKAQDNAKKDGQYSKPEHAGVSQLEHLIFADEDKEEKAQAAALALAQYQVNEARKLNDNLALRRANLRLKNLQNEILESELSKEVAAQQKEEAVQKKRAELKRGRIDIERLEGPSKRENAKILDTDIDLEKFKKLIGPPIDKKAAPAQAQPNASQAGLLAAAAKANPQAAQAAQATSTSTS